MIPETEPELAEQPKLSLKPRLHVAFPRPSVVPLAIGKQGLALNRAFFEDTVGIPNPQASSASHARIDRPNATMRIVDAGGKNGTWVNGAKLDPEEEVTLTEGTVIRIGQVVFVYRESSHLADEPTSLSFQEISGLAPPAVFVGPFTRGALARRIDQLKPGGASRKRVLIEGATGTGKEVVARWIAHALRPGKPFETCNAAQLAEGTGAAELFGHTRGGFTGATSAARGQFDRADGGTLFLDEMGDLHPTLQAGMLRAVDPGEITPVGSDAQKRTVNVLVIAASSVLRARVEDGRFRRDLLARLEEAVVPIPPLAHRREDIPSLVQHLLAQHTPSVDVPPDAAVMEALMLFDWPSNVRELASVLADATVSSGALTKSALPDRVRNPARRASDSYTRGVARDVWKQLGRNTTKAAEHLGAKRPTLVRILEAAGETVRADS